MMGRSPRMDEQGMDMGPRMRAPLDPRPDLGRGAPMGPRPNFGPGLGRGGRPEGDMGLGPMGAGGPRMDLGPRAGVPETRDPRQSADPRRMAASNIGVRPPVSLSSNISVAFSELASLDLILYVIQHSWTFSGHKVQMLISYR